MCGHDELYLFPRSETEFGEQDSNSKFESIYCPVSVRRIDTLKLILEPPCCSYVDAKVNLSLKWSQVHNGILIVIWSESRCSESTSAILTNSKISLILWVFWRQCMHEWPTKKIVDAFQVAWNSNMDRRKPLQWNAKLRGRIASYKSCTIRGSISHCWTSDLLRN
jgi:hypothetical protein